MIYLYHTNLTSIINDPAKFYLFKKHYKCQNYIKKQ